MPHSSKLHAIFRQTYMSYPANLDALFHQEVAACGMYVDSNYHS